METIVLKDLQDLSLNLEGCIATNDEDTYGYLGITVPLKLLEEFPLIEQLLALEDADTAVDVTFSDHNHFYTLSHVDIEHGKFDIYRHETASPWLLSLTLKLNLSPWISPIKRTIDGKTTLIENIKGLQYAKELFASNRAVGLTIFKEHFMASSVTVEFVPTTVVIPTE
ncbi:MAG: hypothetical protein AAB875_04125 [Patescibacteria group bacterium]